VNWDTWLGCDSRAAFLSLKGFWDRLGTAATHKTRGVFSKSLTGLPQAKRRSLTCWPSFRVSKIYRERRDKYGSPPHCELDARQKPKFAFSKVAATKENQGFCSSFPFVASTSLRCAENSVHKLAKRNPTTLGAIPPESPESQFAFTSIKPLR